jgi:hypothetical protein
MHPPRNPSGGKVLKNDCASQAVAPKRVDKPNSHNQGRLSTKLVSLLVDLAQREDRLIDNLSDALASGDSERIRAAATALLAERKSAADPKIAATFSA